MTELANRGIVFDDATGWFLDGSGNQVASFTLRELRKPNGDVVVDWNTGLVKSSVEETTSYITPPALVGHTDDWDPAGILTTSVIRASSVANYEIRGMRFVAGRKLRIINVGPGDIKFKNEALTSIATNRFLTGGDVVIKTNNSAELWGDPASAKWRLVNIFN